MDLPCDGLSISKDGLVVSCSFELRRYAVLYECQNTTLPHGYLIIRNGGKSDARYSTQSADPGALRKQSASWQSLSNLRSSVKFQKVAFDRFIDVVLKIDPGFRAQHTWTIWRFSTNTHVSFHYNHPMGRHCKVLRSNSISNMHIYREFHRSEQENVNGFQGTLDCAACSVDARVPLLIRAWRWSLWRAECGLGHLGSAGQACWRGKPNALAFVYVLWWVEAKSCWTLD